MSESGQVQNGAAFPVCRAPVGKGGFSKPRFGGDSRLKGYLRISCMYLCIHEQFLGGSLVG